MRCCYMPKGIMYQVAAFYQYYMPDGIAAIIITASPNIRYKSR
ncbi:hypothetical protein Dfer_4812 [Dyadobacter fermentans DSM 18053]|uniref:Uncharacterized protein n=1 Tax=Dyadobacter fermentans (strain ATCC 700827 / DSM 18053 / CIP 107007 / KCTC 52180 / NS114) TaxID=471854 RepID=C6W5S4_DYAFD|nr:hypothetical protein Dfer_4812 [Dyadobacter fermentans DSM 18053]